MGLFGDVAKGVATGGISTVYDVLNKKNGNPREPQAAAPRSAKDIGVDPTLMALVGAPGEAAGNSIRAVYDRTKSRYKDSDYANERLGQANTQAMAGLQGSLEGVLGDTAYKNSTAQRGFQEDYDLANYIGELNEPSTLEEILGGLSGAAQAGGQIYGAMPKRQQKRQPQTEYPVTFGEYSDPDSSIMSMYDPYGGSY